MPRLRLACAPRTVQRVRRRAGLQTAGPAVRPKCPPRPGAKRKAAGVNDVWCLGSVFDTAQHGATVKFLTLLDGYSHYNLDIVAGRRPGSREVVESLRPAVAVHGAPRHLHCENGGEFPARRLQTWLCKTGIATRFIESGSPWKNGVNKSFNGWFRDD